VFARAARQLTLGLILGVAAVALFDWLSDGALLGGRQAVLLPAVSLTMLVTGLVAALGPARRGLRIQPTEALRAE
jgi:ABC-type antimicrobial peptide transport system permease subunit